MPQHLTDDWNWIHRPIVPILHQPSFAPGSGSTTGLGDITYQGFLSPAEPGSVIWGVGPTVVLPTARDERLGADEWAVGPGAVALTMNGPWVYGALLSHVWAVEDDDDTDFTTFQPFVNDTFDDGWYVVSAPILTGNHDARRGGDVWTVPIGGGAGRVFTIGERPVNVTLQAYRNIHRPHHAPERSARMQFTLLYPQAPPPN